MTATDANDDDSNTKIRPKRAFCSHTPKWQRFQPTLLTPSSGQAKNKTASEEATQVYAYNKQYSHVYSHRLVALKPRCWKLLMHNDNTEDTNSIKYTRASRVLEIRENVPSRIVGTLIKEANDPDEEPILGADQNNTCRPSDQLFLEDESGRVALKVDNVHEYCTGVVVGVQGTVDKLGTLNVHKLVIPAPVPQPTLSGTTMTPSQPDAKAPHLLLVSSLLCGDPNVSSMPREMLVSYLQGHFTDDASKVCRVVLAGSGPSSQEPLQGIQELDAFCLQTSRLGIPLDIVPSRDDPTTANWPQRPLHSSLLPHATKIVSRTTNPYAAGHGNQFVVGTDGVNVRDLQEHVLKKKEDNPEEQETLSELEALERTLEFGHLCPTGPDSVPTVPHVGDQDPMVLDQNPHVYFCGNAQQFETKKTTNNTTLICVPKFSETGECVLVNLETLDVQLLRFEEEQ